MMIGVFPKEAFIETIAQGDPDVIARLYDVVRTDAFLESAEIARVTADAYKDEADAEPDQLTSVVVRSHGVGARTIADKLLAKAGEALYGKIDNTIN